MTFLAVSTTLYLEAGAKSLLFLVHLFPRPRDSGEEMENSDDPVAQRPTSAPPDTDSTFDSPTVELGGIETSKGKIDGRNDAQSGIGLGNIFSQEIPWSQRSRAQQWFPFRGMYHDVKRRLPYYWTDWTEAFHRRNLYRVVAATLRMYALK